MSQLKCPTCPFRHDPARDPHHRCTACGTCFCLSCGGKHGWKCPVCKDPFCRLEHVTP